MVIEATTTRQYHTTYAAHLLGRVAAIDPDEWTSYYKTADIDGDGEPDYQMNDTVGKEGADLLFQLVSRRYERRSTIVTTNVGIGAWAKVFGDPVVASAIADRLCHHCTVLRITGRSYRTKDLAPQDRGERGQDGSEGGA